MKTRSIVAGLCYLSFSVLFACTAWYALHWVEKKDPSLLSLCLYGVLLATLASAGLWVGIRLQKAGSFVLRASVGVVLWIGLIVAAATLANMVFGPGTSKYIGVLPTLVSLPLFLTLLLPLSKKDQDERRA